MQTISFTLCFQSEMGIELAEVLLYLKKSRTRLKHNLERPCWSLKAWKWNMSPQRLLLLPLSSCLWTALAKAGHAT